MHILSLLLLALGTAAERASLVSDTLFLRYTLTDVSLGTRNEQVEADQFETAWDILLNHDGSYAVKPLVYSDRFLSTDDGKTASLGTSDSLSGHRWRLTQNGDKGFKFENVDYAGFFLGNTRDAPRQLILSNTSTEILSFRLQYPLLPTVPQHMFAVNMDAFENSGLRIPGLSLGYPAIDSFAFSRVNVLKQGLYYRIHHLGSRDFMIASQKDNVALTTQTTDLLQLAYNATWIVRLRYLDESFATLMFESAFYPGLFLGKRNSLYTLVSLAETKEASSTLFNVTLEPSQLKFRVSPDDKPVVTALLSHESYLRYLDYKTYADKPHENDILWRYATSWTIYQKGEDSAIQPLSLPNTYLSNSTQVLQGSVLNITEAKGLQWRLTPFAQTEGFVLQSLTVRDQYLHHDRETNVVTFSTRPSIWQFATPFHFNPIVFLLDMQVGFLFGKTVKLTDIYNSETLAVTNNDAAERTKVYRFIVNEPLNGADGYFSLQSLVFPNYYLRHNRFGLLLESYEGDYGFANDATWKMKYAFLNYDKTTTVSIEAFGFPGLYVSTDKLMVKKIENEKDEQRASFLLEEVKPLKMNTPGSLRRKKRNLDEL